MWLLEVGALLVGLYCGERITTLRRRARAIHRRATAEYPTTGNDPVGRTFV